MYKPEILNSLKGYSGKQFLTDFIAGIIVGCIMPTWMNNIFTVIATIYMSALKMMIFPLVFCSLLLGIVGIGNIAKTGKIGLHAICWYVGTTAFASGLGLIYLRFFIWVREQPLLLQIPRWKQQALVDCWIPSPH